MRRRILAGLLSLCLLVGLAACGQQKTDSIAEEEAVPTWQELYDEGQRAMEAKDYETAAAKFEEAIEADSTNPLAYGALADAYLALEDTDKAQEALQRGVDATGDATLQARLDAMLSESNTLTPPTYLVGYLGMTINQVAELWGSDYTVEFLDGEHGSVIYYPDLRIPALLTFDDPNFQASPTGNETIVSIQDPSYDAPLAKGITSGMTLAQLQNKFPNAEYYDGSDGSSMYQGILTCQIDETTAITFCWVDNDPSSDYPDEVQAYHTDTPIHTTIDTSPDTPNKSNSQETNAFDLAEVEKKQAELEKPLKDRFVPQQEMNYISGDVYELWDDTLNQLWGILKETLPKEKMQQLTAEQREWIASRDAKVDAESNDYKGGTMYPLVRSSTASELTKARVYELMKYLE